MISKKKHGKNKRRFWNRFKLGLTGLLSILMICYAAYSSLNASNINIPQTSGFKAAIVDHLSLTQPNQTFVQTATNTLKQAGYTVDYYPGEEVTVEFYRSLPTHGYKIIILRVHSTAALRSGTEYVETPVSFFTSEPVSTNRYIYEQLTEQLVKVFYLPYSESDPSYFGITDNFIREGMNGKFNNTIIIMMGCDGLTNAEMAKAFLERGTKVYIGWNGPVLASYTDYSTTCLLQRLLIEKQTIDQALMETSTEIGADPAYNSLLLYYPLEAGDVTIQSIVVHFSPNITEVRTQKVFTKIERYRIQ